MDDNNVFTLNKIIRYLKELDADIICLQEVLYNQFALLKQSLKVDGIFAANINKPTLMYGIATLSKNEILYNEHIFLKSKGEQRGFLHTNVFSECCCIDVINTHLGLDKDSRWRCSTPTCCAIRCGCAAGARATPSFPSVWRGARR